MRLILVTLIFLSLATPALASDGVLEINQTCAVQTGCLPSDLPGFPVAILFSGSYRLTSNLVVPDEFTNGLAVGARSVTIDLNGFEIVRSGCEPTNADCTSASGTGAGIYAAVGNEPGTAVRNGTITGMGGDGIRLGVQAEVTNLRARFNRLDGISVRSGSTLSNNTVYRNGGNGITSNNGSTVTGNTAHLNGADGILIQGGVTVSGNTTYENNGAGIHATNGCTVIRNTSYSNGWGGTDSSSRAGIECASGCIVRENAVRNNFGHGLDLGSDSVYSDNVVTINNTGTVTGGLNLGGNVCNGLLTCP